MVTNLESALQGTVPGFRIEGAEKVPTTAVVPAGEKEATETGFRLAPLKDLPPAMIEIGDSASMVKSDTRQMTESEAAKIKLYCPKCTSVNVRRTNRSGMWEEFLRLFFIAPFRCRSCRHKFYRF